MREQHDYREIPEVTFLGKVSDFSLRRPVRTALSAIRFIRAIRKHKIDIVHVCFAEPNALWVSIASMTAAKWVLTTRGSDVLVSLTRFSSGEKFNHRYLWRLYSNAIRRFDAICCTSSSQITFLLEKCNFKGTITRITTGFDSELVNTDTSEYLPSGIHAMNLIVVPRGVLPIYNPHFILRSIARMQKELRRNVQIVLCGLHNTDITQAEFEAEYPDLPIVYLGKLAQESLYELYKRATVTIMVPTTDGSPVSGMEALACGSPLILGPAHYDNDIFQQAERLTSFDEELLCKLLSRIVAGNSRTREPLIADYSSQSELNKVATLYNQLID